MLLDVLFEGIIFYISETFPGIKTSHLLEVEFTKMPML